MPRASHAGHTHVCCFCLSISLRPTRLLGHPCGPCAPLNILVAIVPMRLLKPRRTHPLLVQGTFSEGPRRKAFHLLGQLYPEAVTLGAQLLGFDPAQVVPQLLADVDKCHRWAGWVGACRLQSPLGVHARRQVAQKSRRRQRCASQAGRLWMHGLVLQCAGLGAGRGEAEARWVAGAFACVCACVRTRACTRADM